MNALSAFFSSYPTVFPWMAGILGLAVGSFLNVVIYRFPIMMERKWREQCQDLLKPSKKSLQNSERFDLIAPGSSCPACGHSISALENIPVASFLWLRGQCSACGKGISWRYPFIELLTGILTAFVAGHIGYGIPAFAAMIFTWFLIALFFIDYDQQLLPDDITLPLMWTGLFFNVFGVFTSPNSAIIGAISGYIFFWLVYQGFKLATSKEGMGYGDFKLLAALGAWLGWQILPFIVLLASLIGAMVGIFLILFFSLDRRRPIPFGPFLCAAGWVALFWGDTLTRYYLQAARIGGGS